MQAKVQTEHGMIVVSLALSSRNLDDLIAQRDEAHRRYGTDAVLIGYLQKVDHDTVVYLTIEDDLSHYGDRRPGPGSGLVPDAIAPGQADRLRQERDAEGSPDATQFMHGPGD